MAIVVEDITVASVVAILDPDGVEGTQESINSGELDIQFGIDTAVALYNEVCTAAKYSDAYGKTITQWLAAHFVSVPLPKTKQEAAKGLTETSEGQTRMGLDFTRFGQQAKTLDFKGYLARIDQVLPSKGRRTGSVTYVGGTSDPRKGIRRCEF